MCSNTLPLFIASYIFILILTVKLANDKAGESDLTMTTNISNTGSFLTLASNNGIAYFILILVNVTCE